MCRQKRGQVVAEEIRAAGGRAFSPIAMWPRRRRAKRPSNKPHENLAALSIIVNCAGIVQVKLLDELDEADWDRLMAINVKSIYLSIKYGLAHLKRNARSYVVNIGSISSYVGQGGTPAYTARRARC